MGPPSPSAERTVPATEQRTGREDDEQPEEEEEGEGERLGGDGRRGKTEEYAK